MSDRADSSSDLAAAFAHWRPKLLRALFRRLGNRDDAEEIAQESFLRLAAAGKALPLDEQGPYLQRIALNLSHDLWRNSPARQQVDLVAYDDGEIPAADIAAEGDCPCARTEQRQRLERLQQALDELPERQREAFVLHRFDGLTQDQVGERMGISRRMVVKHLARAFAYCEIRVQYASLEQMEHLHPAATRRADDDS
ncbi:sigma-70 family RNA polymerase sigma factor [Pseudothauera nasutitermitis]|uniref:Sigma-70 family RNA polymerase sigma factor n=1 Tax=Pseudothauera nasutitermitis TaxID=2565930 RepID=A0A4S4B3J0_9RHOO|nr:sigma-70 family RNA polymerase sigma factor [Pseudothauera nasutitermitis]THF67125.1 sigma-70 family RNA polymerase sigma factor [Pseudothauera nasutitermitis]